MSPYLHFGQIFPLYIALKVKETKSTGIEAFLEELIVQTASLKTCPFIFI
jgi:deoxyribodipyrimidine photo-lyase